MKAILKVHSIATKFHRSLKQIHTSQNLMQKRSGKNGNVSMVHQHKATNVFKHVAPFIPRGYYCKVFLRPICYLVIPERVNVYWHVKNDPGKNRDFDPVENLK